MSLGRAMYSGFTMGGLAVTLDGEVLRGDGSTVPGLYAAGACASNIAQDGKGYSSGTQLGEGSFFGPARRHACGTGEAALDGREPPGPVTEQLEPTIMVLFERGAMTDADHDAVRQPGAQRPVQRELLSLVECGGRFVEEDRLRLVQQYSGERDALLLAGRQDLAQSATSSRRSPRCPSDTVSSAEPISSSECTPSSAG
jgi:hypothetical protein